MKVGCRVGHHVSLSPRKDRRAKTCACVGLHACAYVGGRGGVRVSRSGL